MKTSQRLHSLLWSLRKRIQNIRNNIKNSNYKTLKENNELICELNDNLSKIKVFDELLRNETDEMTSLWDKIHFEDSRFKERISENFRDEVEKSENREATIQQLTEELNVLTSEVENRLELIMTRDNMRLNIILLILTVISVLGVAEVVGFTEEQWKVVVVVLLPFVFLTVFYMRNFLKNFNKRDKKTNK
jgi:predicted nuclease with TOPRIM domain